LPALLLASVPGILLLATPVARRLDRGSSAVHVVGVSLAFWMVAFWFLPLLPFSLSGFFRAASLAALAGFAWLALRRPGLPPPPPDPRLCAAACAFVGLVLALRAVPMGLAVVPAGADMSMHTYLAELIVRADGVPTSYRPILGLDSFDTFPVGFHTLSALISLLAGLPSYQSAHLVALASHAWLSFTLFAFLRSHVGLVASLLGAITFTFLVGTPQGMIAWGGNPTVLGIAFAALFASTLKRFPRWDGWDVLLAASSLVAVLLTHSIVFIQTCYLLGLSFAIQQALGLQRGRLVRAAALGLACAAIAGPYLAGIDLAIATPEALDWIRNWVRNADHVWHGSVADCFWTIPDYVVRRFGDRMLAFLPPAALGIACLWRRDRSTLGLYLGFCGMGFLLVLNCRYWVLPLSYLVYPERTVAMLGLPLSLFFACGLQALPPVFVDWLRRGVVTRIVVGIAVLAALLGLVRVMPDAGRRFYLETYVEPSVANSSVTEADLRAIRWIEDHSRPGDVVVTNYGDAGVWIPGIAFRRVTRAHVNVAHLASFEAPRSGRFAFVGSKCVYGCPGTRKTYANDPGWTLRYEEEGSAVFETRDTAPTRVEAGR
jgi:hypothetical protein